MGKKFKRTDVYDGTTSRKYDVKTSISINDQDVLENLYEAIDVLSDRSLSKSPEDGGQGMTKDDFVADSMSIIENSGKFQANITII